jgi:hypothetical protein
MSGMRKTNVSVGAARMAEQKIMDSRDTSILENLRNTSTALSLASIAPIPIVSPVLKGLSTVSDLAGDVIDPKVSAASTAKNFVGGAAGTVASIVPGGGAAVKVVEVARKVDKGMKIYDGITNVASVAGAANASSLVSGGESVTAISTAKTPKVPTVHTKTPTH